MFTTQQLLTIPQQNRPDHLDHLDHLVLWLNALPGIKWHQSPRGLRLNGVLENPAVRRRADRPAEDRAPQQGQNMASHHDLFRGPAQVGSTMRACDDDDNDDGMPAQGR